MWKRISGSLTLRIFLITTALLMAACALTYGAIAYLTPISYTTILEDELYRETDALAEQLAGGNAEDADVLLADFTRRTGADARLRPWPTQVSDLNPGITHLDAAVTIVEGVQYAYDDEEGPDPILRAEAAAGTGSAPYSQITMTTENISVITKAHREITFQDGQQASLEVSGGLRAVNRTTEAMRRVLPWLSMILILFSLAGSFFYARFITRPIVSMSAIATRMAKLDFHARWTHPRRDEIGTLGESLNRLSDNLSGTLNDLQAANAALRQDIERERELERQRLAFFSATSHELKTPVTILKGQLSGMLAQVGVYQDREKYLARALEVVNRMESLIRQILAVSRVESHTAVVKKERVDMGMLIHAQLEQDAELMERQGLRLLDDVTDDVILEGDKKLLSAAIDNVLMNAILYSPRGAVVRVALNKDCFCVENSDVHIEDEALAHIFEPFYRVEQSRSRKTGGSGLGLYLVKSIFALHGASCKIENTPSGVRFAAMLQD